MSSIKEAVRWPLVLCQASCSIAKYAVVFWRLAADFGWNNKSSSRFFFILMGIATRSKMGWWLGMTPQSWIHWFPWPPNWITISGSIAGRHRATPCSWPPQASTRLQPQSTLHLLPHTQPPGSSPIPLLLIPLIRSPCSSARPFSLTTEWTERLRAGLCLYPRQSDHRPPDCSLQPEGGAHH